MGMAFNLVEKLEKTGDYCSYWPKTTMILGIAPLMYSVDRMFGLRIGKIKFIGTHDSDYDDFILSEKSEECMELFVNHLNNIPEKWGYMELTDIPENAKCIPVLSKVSKS